MAEPRIGRRPLRPHGPDRRAETVVLEAAGTVLAAGLLSGTSAFTPGVAVWTTANADRLVAAFARCLQGGPDSLIDKLLVELASAPAGALQLAGELQYLMFLAAADVKAQTKRERVTAFLDLMPEPIRMPPELSQACEAGVFNVGMGFKMQGWRQLRTLYEFVQRWVDSPPAVRADASASPWSFKRFVEHAGGARAMRNLLMYLAFPDAFEPIVSQTHKEQIRDAFIAEVGVRTDDVDRDLLTIRDHLETGRDEPISFYGPELAARWRRTGASGPVAVPARGPLRTRRAWLVRGSSVRGKDLVPDWLREGNCSLAAAHLPLGEAGMSRAQLVEQVEVGYGFASYNERNTKVAEFHDFLTRMSVDDVVVTTSGGVLYLGYLTGEPVFGPSRDGRSNLTRPVRWANAAEPIDIVDLPPLLRSRLAAQQDVVDLSRDLPQLEPLLALAQTPQDSVDDVEDAVLDLRASLPDATDGLAERLTTPKEWLQEVIELLRERRQIVLYGPPGTGKTFLAHRLAQHLTGDPQNVKLVQFHPTYSYEDFFEGYRPRPGPDGAMAFELRPGPFRRLVDRAREDPARPYVLIVDELNRANLATVFGELYFLLEYREEAIDLLYSGDEQGFTLPENVFLIGTMNTADRSVALVDSAMRRRFGFVPLHPAEEPVRTLLPRWLEARGRSSTPARLLRALNDRIADHDLAVGPSYFMHETGPGDDEAHLRRVWRTSILPLLEEYHYGTLTPAQVVERYGFDALRATIAEPR
jgi:5-methylcytosine-specific restriction enzyme B